MTASAPAQTVTFSKSDPVQLRERVPEPPRAAVRIPVELACRAFDRLLRSREGPVGAFVRSELDDALETELSLDLFDRLAGLVRDELCERWSNRRPIRVGRSPIHVAGIGSGAAVTYSPTISLSSSRSTSVDADPSSAPSAAAPF